MLDAEPKLETTFSEQTSSSSFAKVKDSSEKLDGTTEVADLPACQFGCQVPLVKIASGPHLKRIGEDSSISGLIRRKTLAEKLYL